MHWHEKPVVVQLFGYSHTVLTLYRKQVCSARVCRLWFQSPPPYLWG